MITVHTENTFGDYKDPPTTSPNRRLRIRSLSVQEWRAAICPFKDRFQIVQIVVGENAELGTTKARSINDGGMDEFVHNDDVILFEQRTDRPESRRIAGRETERAGGSFE